MKTDKKIDLQAKLAKAESEKMQIERELKKDKSSDDENFASIKKDISKLENKIRERENQMSPDLTDSLVSKINSIEDELKPLRAAESRMTTLKEKFSMYDISSALLNIFEDSIDIDSLVFTQVGQNLLIRNNTNDDEVSIRNYFADATNNLLLSPVQIIQLPDGSELDLGQVTALTQ